jgi:hypothetical protein
MTLHCLIFVAAQRHARARARADELADALHLADGIDAAALQRLWALLQGVDYNPGWHRLIDMDFGTHDRSVTGRLRSRLRVWWAAARAVAGQPAPPRWLRRLPPPFVELLAALPLQSVDAIARQWRAAAGVETVAKAAMPAQLMALQARAAQAQAERSGLWLSVRPAAP